jgi:hypothetical protein
VLSRSDDGARYTTSGTTLETASDAISVAYGYAAEHPCAVEDVARHNGKQLRFVTKDGAPKRVLISTGSMRFGARDVAFFICANDCR